jgi:hypothetical protein
MEQNLTFHLLMWRTLDCEGFPRCVYLPQDCEAERQ